MKGYKAFKKGLVCRGKQYAENTVFTEDHAEPCQSGMHFCKNPLDTLNYYPLIDENGNVTEFAEVEALDDVLTDDDEKFCTKKLKIGAKISILSFVRASVQVMRETITAEANKKGGYRAQLAGGNHAKLAGGDEAQLAGGYRAQLAGGENSVVVGDHGSIAKGKRGSVIVLVERGALGEITAYKAGAVDGVTLKEDTYYRLENGEFIEVK